MKTIETLYTHYEQTIIDSITLEYYTNKEMTLFEKINFVFDTFKIEYLHHNNQHLPIQTLFKEWLQGLPSVLTVPFYNFDILENAKKNGYTFECVETEDKFLEKYFMNCSKAFFNLKNNL